MEYESVEKLQELLYLGWSLHKAGLVPCANTIALGETIPKFGNEALSQEPCETTQNTALWSCVHVCV